MERVINEERQKPGTFMILWSLWPFDCICSRKEKNMIESSADEFISEIEKFHQRCTQWCFFHPGISKYLLHFYTLDPCFFYYPIKPHTHIKMCCRTSSSTSCSRCIFEFDLYCHFTCQTGKYMLAEHFLYFNSPKFSGEPNEVDCIWGNSFRL